MRNTPNVRAERFRVREGLLASAMEDGNYGAFKVPQKNGPTLVCVVSAGTDPDCPEALGWEHVSVSTAHRCPTWEEMNAVKDLFWREDEVVFQLHPAKKDWVNFHGNCLHLWRHRDQEVPLPPAVLVGPHTGI